MATVTVNVNANTKDATQDINNLDKALDGAAGEAEKLNTALEAQENRIKTLGGAINIVGGSVEVLAGGLALTGGLTEEQAERFESAAIGAIAFADGTKRVFEGVKDAFGVQDDQQFIQGNDSFFDRIEPVFAEDGKAIKEFKIVDPRGGYMDEAVPASTVRSLLADAQTYAYLTKYLQLKANGANADELASLAPAGN